MKTKRKPTGMNAVAIAVSKLEGKKVQVNIAQIKETLRCLKGLTTEHQMIVLNYMDFSKLWLIEYGK